jgi:hypothetical protein
MTRLTFAVVLLASVAVAAQSRPADDNAFPRTKSRGRATIEYRDESVHAAAVYDYSQRNHQGAWLLVQTGVAVQERTSIRRENFFIVFPDGREVPLATQQQFLADSAAITRLRQNASIFQRDVKTYFPASKYTDILRFVALPGDGLARELSFLLEEQAVAIGDLYFKSPTLRWEAGTYRFVFDHQKGRAELPIRLE